MTYEEPKQEYFEELDPVEDIEVEISDLKGEEFLATYRKIYKIINHQFDNGIRKGIAGFLFYGPPGTGKTSLAKALAKELMTRELFVDGANVARALYGQSEQAITRIFAEARKRGECIILIDDAESIFPKREWRKGQAWHVAQNNVFFHQLDNLDTSKTVAVLTTNKVEMMDEAVCDRLYEFEFPPLPKETLIAIAERRCEELEIPSEKVVKKIESSDIKSVREIEKIIWDEYVEEI